MNKMRKSIKDMIGCVLFSEFLSSSHLDLKTAAFSECFFHGESILDFFLWVFLFVCLLGFFGVGLFSFLYEFISFGMEYKIGPFWSAFFSVTPFFFPKHYFFRIHWQLIWISHLITEYHLITCKPFLCK